MPPVPSGRSATLTDHKVTVVVETTRKGGSLRQAAKKAQVTFTTINQWVDRGKYLLMLEEREADGEPIAVEDREKFARTIDPEMAKLYVDFYKRYVAADAEYQGSMVGYIDNAAPQDWRAAAWQLEKRYPEEYGKAIAIHQSVDVKEMSDDELDKLINSS